MALPMTGLVFLPSAFQCFINNLAKAMKGLFVKFADDSRLCGVAKIVIK